MKSAKISTMYYSYVNSLWHIAFSKLNLSALGNQHQRNAELHRVEQARPDTALRIKCKLSIETLISLRPGKTNN